MSQVLLITLYDFPEFWPLSTNISADLVDPYIGRAQTFDVRPLLTATEWAGFEANLGKSAGEFPGLEFSPQEFFTNPPATEWDNDRLAALWNGYVRPLLVTESFRLLTLWHGSHFTQNGIEQFAGDGNQPVSSARRAELKADIESHRNLYRSRLEAALQVYRGTTPTTCSGVRRRRGRGGVSTHAI